jgi:hypothetical protein
MVPKWKKNLFDGFNFYVKGDMRFKHNIQLLWWAFMYDNACEKNGWKVHGWNDHFTFHLLLFFMKVIWY